MKRFRSFLLPCIGRNQREKTPAQKFESYLNEVSPRSWQIKNQVFVYSFERSAANCSFGRQRVPFNSEKKELLEPNVFP